MWDKLRHEVRSGDLQELMDRKKQFEEEVKVARLTGVSKNTNGSANSLEYSPSPAKQGGGGGTIVSESPQTYNNANKAGQAYTDQVIN